MTRQRYLELKSVMEAWANGELIQLKKFNESEWRACPVPDSIGWSDTDYEFRIKHKAREVWVVYDDKSDTLPSCFSNLREAKEWADKRQDRYPCAFIVHMMEGTL